MGTKTRTLDVDPMFWVDPANFDGWCELTSEEAQRAATQGGGPYIRGMVLVLQEHTYSSLHEMASIILLYNDVCNAVSKFDLDPVWEGYVKQYKDAA